jgi:uncharacterized protein
MNARKHGVSFSVAARVFDDPFALMVQDRIEAGEYRWQTIGLVAGQLLLLVAHTVHDRPDGSGVIRLISARRTTKRERKRYEENRLRSI